jgi:hypothetical protein
MKRTLPAFAQLVFLLGLATWCLGCGMTRVSLVDTGAIRLESSAAGKVYVAWSDAYAADDGFVVSGVVKRRDRVGPPIKVTVNAEIVSPSGVILYATESDHLYVPRPTVNRVQGFERFRVHFPERPPEGSSVRIVARAG